jgi:hypothetical protein
LGNYIDGMREYLKVDKNENKNVNHQGEEEFVIIRNPLHIK